MGHCQISTPLKSQPNQASEQAASTTGGDNDVVGQGQLYHFLKFWKWRSKTQDLSLDSEEEEEVAHTECPSMVGQLKP